MTPAPVLVRAAVRTDLPMVLGLLRLLREPTADDVTLLVVSAEAERGWTQLCAQQGRTLLVAVDGGSLVGVVDLAVAPNVANEADPWATLENVVVHPRCRRRRVGTALVEAAIERARAAGCYRLSVTSVPANTAAHRLFRSCGLTVEVPTFRAYLT